MNKTDTMDPDQQILSCLTQYTLRTSAQIGQLTGPWSEHDLQKALLRLELDGKIVGKRMGWPARRRYRVAGRP